MARLIPISVDPLFWRLHAARAVLWVERLAAGLWPACALLAGLAGLALFGLAALLPWALHVGLLVVAFGALAVLLARGAVSLRAPDRAAAERRLEQDSGLAHRPFAALRDRPASPPGALWVLHQARARTALTQLRLRAPHAALARRDPYALRWAGVLLLAAGLFAAGGRAGARLQAALLPGLPLLSRAAAPSVQAWIQPPAYTGLSPVFLAQGGADPGAPVSVPAGSRLTVSVTGLATVPHLDLAGHGLPVERLGPDSFQSVAVMHEGGRLTLGGGWGALSAWTLALVPNEPPEARWPSLPGRAGTTLSSRLPWHVQQRWGVARLEALLVPAGHDELPVRHIPLPLPGTPKSASGSAVSDLSADPYAGLTMTARLAAQDVSGQHGTSGPAELVLPARTFHHPLARAVAELRRRLALHPASRADLADELQALAQAPLAQKVPGLTASGVVLNLSAAATLLASQAAQDPAVVDEVQARLWALALALDGALPDAAARALAEARENLRHGIDEHARGQLDDKALRQRLDALRQALDRRLDELARRAMQQGALQHFDPKTQHLSAPSIDRLVRRLEHDLREGRMDEARRDMEALDRLAEQLKNAHVMTPEEARAQEQQQREDRQRQGAVQDMVQREATLLDHAQQRAPAATAPEQRPFTLPPDLVPAEPLGQPPGGTDDQSAEPQPFGPSPQQGDQSQEMPPAAQPPAAPPPAAPHARQDALTQGALHRALDALKDGLAQAGQKKPPSLDDASQAMQDASSALSQGQDPQARDAISRAIAALQKGGQEMARQSGQQGSEGMQLSLQQGGGQGSEGQDGEGQEEGQSRAGQKRDPFGRPVDGNGTAADDPGLRLPDQMEQGRSREIQQELRRRGADQGRSKGELDYIERLLKAF